MNQAEIIKELTARIDRGEEKYKYGERLPSTRDLAQEFDSTQQTVAAAFSVMAGMGLVSVRRGSGATVITGRPGRIKLGTYRSANREIATSATAWKRDHGNGAKEGPTQVNHIVITEADADTGIEVGAEVVERIRTRYDGDGAPCQHKRTLITADAATLTPEGWTGLPPMMRAGDVKPPEGLTISKWLGMGVVRVTYDMCVSMASGPAAEALTIPEGTPALRIVSRGLRQDGSVAFATVTTAPMRSTVSLEIQEGDA
jgi:GntR family transcriptional regulator